MQGTLVYRMDRETPSPTEGIYRPLLPKHFDEIALWMTYTTISREQSAPSKTSIGTRNEASTRSSAAIRTVATHH